MRKKLKTKNQTKNHKKKKKKHNTIPCLLPKKKYQIKNNNKLNN